MSRAFLASQKFHLQGLPSFLRAILEAVPRDNHPPPKIGYFDLLLASIQAVFFRDCRLVPLPNDRFGRALALKILEVTIRQHVGKLEVLIQATQTSPAL